MSGDGNFFDEDAADALAALGAAVDQFIEIQRPNARAAWGVYTAYVDAGFSEGQAFAAVMEYVRRWAS